MIDLPTNTFSLSPEVMVNNETEMKELSNLSTLMLEQDNYAIKFEIFQIFDNLLDADTSFKNKSLYNLLFIDVLPYYLEYLKEPILPFYQKENILTKQLIIDLVNKTISHYRSSIQYWIKQNKVCDKILQVLLFGSKILDLSVIRFVKTILLYGDFFFVSEFLNKELLHKLIFLFEKNKKKDNLILAALCDLFNSLVSKEKLLNQLFIMKREFFYENQIFFSDLIDKIERKPEKPKPLIKQLSVNKDSTNVNSNLGDNDIIDDLSIFQTLMEKNSFLNKKRWSNLIETININSKEENETT